MIPRKCIYHLCALNHRHALLMSELIVYFKQAFDIESAGTECSVERFGNRIENPVLVLEVKLRYIRNWFSFLKNLNISLSVNKFNVDTNPYLYFWLVCTRIISVRSWICTTVYSTYITYYTAANIFSYATLQIGKLKKIRLIIKI